MKKGCSKEMEKTNIIIVAYPLVPDKVGGVETYFKGILSALLKHLPSFCDAYLILGKAATSYARFWVENGGNPQNCFVSDTFPEITSLWSRSRALGKSICFPRALRQEIQNLQPSLVFFPLTVCVPFLPQKGREFPIVTTVHDVLHLVQPKMFKSISEKIYRAAVYRPTILDSDGLIVPSEYTKETLHVSYQLDLKKIKVIPYGVDLDLFSNDSTGQEEHVLAKYHLHRERYVIYPANTWFHKNHQGLILAWKKIFSKLPEDVWLVFCGQIFQALPDANDLLRYRIKHIGFVEQRELSVLYRRAHAMVFSSFFEGFGAPPVEAMACGTVTISSNKASLAEVLPKDYTLQFDPTNHEEMASALLVGCTDDGVRRTAIVDGLARSRQFSWDNAAMQHINLFIDLINENQG